MGYERLSRRHRLSPAEISSIAADLAEFATLVEPTERLQVVLDDPDDDKLLDAAVAGHADFIISGDHHLLELRTYRGIRVVSPAVFVLTNE
jgi:putative PIN family toxin of toxin-antitoxin system